MFYFIVGGILLILGCLCFVKKADFLFLRHRSMEDFEKEYDVKAGDAILVLYASYREEEVPVKDRRKVRDIVIIRNEDLYNNFKLNKKYEESQNSGNCIKSCCPEAPCSEC